MKKGIGALQVYDLNGKLMQERTLNENSASLQNLDLSNMENGVYKVHIRVNHQIYSTKFVVERLY